MIHRLGSEHHPSVKDSLRRRCGVAALEWIKKLESEKEKVEIYAENEDGLKGCMMLHRGINVFITTDSETTLKEFLGVLDKDEEYAFRCPEWAAPIVMGRFKPREEGYAGVILLTYYTDKRRFKKYTDPRHIAKPLREDAAEEILKHTRRHFTLEFIRGRIREGYFYGIYENNELVSWVGTLWESMEACEVGFAYTKEEHRSKGLMRIVASVVTEKVLKEGTVPVAHTVETNVPAIKVLKRLGYRLAAREWAYYS